MSVTIYSGSMKSSKSHRLIEVAKRLKLQEKKFVICYPSMCSNGEKDIVKSGSGLSEMAYAVSEPLDLYAFVSGCDNILIDEAQFIAHSDEQIQDFVAFILYCEKNNVNVYIGLLNTNFLNHPFKVFQAVVPYANKIHILKAVCEICKCGEGSKTLRIKDGKPSGHDEEILIEKHDKSVEYFAVCPACYYRAYKE